MSAPFQPFNDRPALLDDRDRAIVKLANHNLAMRLMLATARPDMADIPGPYGQVRQRP